MTKLNNFQTHTSEDIKLLEGAVCEERAFGKDEDVIREDSTANHVYLVVKGWVSRYRTNRHGKVQTLNFQIPGDFCNLHTNLTQKIEYSIGTLVPSVIAYIPHDRIEGIYRNHIRLTRSFNWLAFNEISILQEWLINVGSRASHQRLAHLLCELLIRARAAGLTVDHCFHLPLTQAQLGEAMGITHIHTNRVMKRLRAEGLITFENRILDIKDWAGIKEYADFDPRYLQLDNAEPELIRDL
ncbi:cAMP-binding domain of CRP or a regulatory subunit of cAMP-dependent protein kinases [Halomonas korlensis]|uniref:cAMP-binding domain of CRP or a regulatory subunit of cAMP-dependent protein kinases n=1 Tax=Halomonas korlensis TaxID=463301 RepID=A0A1I7G1T1_9GAMM|nr:cAMP-binding domain of CRP or a regulatory subunit of cAMP-dependent protein kinases [Halomonas korlensis]